MKGTISGKNKGIPLRRHIFSEIFDNARYRHYQTETDRVACDERQELAPLISYLKGQTVKTWENQIRRAKNKGDHPSAEALYQGEQSVLYGIEPEWYRCV